MQKRTLTQLLRQPKAIAVARTQSNASTLLKFFAPAAFFAGVFYFLTHWWLPLFSG